MWKFQDFSITHILCENKVRESRVSKSAILINCEALNFEFYEFLHFLRAQIDQINKFQSPKKVKKKVFSDILDSPKLISLKSE